MKRGIFTDGEFLVWKWYQYGQHKRLTEQNRINGTGECWVTQNLKTKKIVYCNSESACLKIIELAHALYAGERKPLNHKTLERKAKSLEGFPFSDFDKTDWDRIGFPYSSYEENNFKSFMNTYQLEKDDDSNGNKKSVAEKA